MGCITEIQCCKIKSSIVDMNNYLNKVYSSFNRLYKKLSLGFSLIDNFPNCFSFYTVNYKDKDIFNNQIHLLDKIINNSSSNTENILVIADASIKNNVTTSILYICSDCNIFAKTIHYVTNYFQSDMALIKPYKSLTLKRL